MSGACFVLFSSDQVKTCNVNTECVNSTSQQMKNHVEGKILIYLYCDSSVKNKPWWLEPGAAPLLTGVRTVSPVVGGSRWNPSGAGAAVSGSGKGERVTRDQGAGTRGPRHPGQAGPRPYSGDDVSTSALGHKVRSLLTSRVHAVLPGRSRRSPG